MRKFGYLPELDTTVMLDQKKQGILNREAHLLNRIKALERQVEDEQARCKAYYLMLDLAEKEFKLPIRKKLSTKQ